MKFLLSGEGSSDLGRVNGPGDWGEGETFEPGPMAWILDRIVESQCNYSPLETQAARYVPEAALTREERKSRTRTGNRGAVLPGRGRPQGTGYFFKNAQVLGRRARAWQEDDEDNPGSVVAVLFRDCDGTRSSSRGLWKEKVDSMRSGFRSVDCELGVPMVPKPKSEAWLLCALKRSPYQGCADLEDLSGNDDSPRSPKKLLAEAVGSAVVPVPAEEQVDWVRTGRVDPSRIQMPSFDQFKADLLEAVGRAV